MPTNPTSPFDATAPAPIGMLPIGAEMNAAMSLLVTS